MTENGNRSLAERIAEDYADAWRPTAGDSIIGFIQEITIGSSDYGEYPIITVVLPDGKGRASIHAFHSVLQEAVIEAAPTIGEEIAAKYNGLRVPKSWEGRKDIPAEGSKDDPRYHDYRFIVNRAPADIWGKFASKRAAKSAE